MNEKKNFRRLYKIDQSGKAIEQESYGNLKKKKNSANILNTKSVKQLMVERKRNYKSHDGKLKI